MADWTRAAASAVIGFFGDVGMVDGLKGSALGLRLLGM